MYNKVIVFILLGLPALKHGFPTEKEVKTWRIIEGTDAAPGEIPYQVSLQNLMDNHVCGGSIISQRTIVTAAHCVVGRPMGNGRIMVGSVTLNTGGTYYSISRIISHPNFDSDTSANDISLVIAFKTIVIGPGVSVIPISAETIGAGVASLATGWGSTSFRGSGTNNLKKVLVNTISISDCKNALASIGIITDTNICTFTKFGEGTCHGDSGGPLVGNGQLIGIISWGYPCAVGLPDVYARVSSYYSWIMTNMQ